MSDLLIIIPWTLVGSLSTALFLARREISELQRRYWHPVNCECEVCWPEGNMEEPQDGR